MHDRAQIDGDVGDDVNARDHVEDGVVAESDTAKVRKRECDSGASTFMMASLLRGKSAPDRNCAWQAIASS